jgi:hypothetical protein
MLTSFIIGVLLLYGGVWLVTPQEDTHKHHYQTGPNN